MHVVSVLMTWVLINVRRLLEVITSHDDGKPSLVFCTSRKECEHAALALVKHAIGPRNARMQPFVRSDEARTQLIAASRLVVDKSLQGKSARRCSITRSVLLT